MERAAGLEVGCKAAYRCIATVSGVKSRNGKARVISKLDE